MARFKAAPASPLFRKLNLTLFCCSKAAMTSLLAANESCVITVRVTGPEWGVWVGGIVEVGCAVQAPANIAIARKKVTNREILIMSILQEPRMVCETWQAGGETQSMWTSLPGMDNQ
jgi:hypothetical protein